MSAVLDIRSDPFAAVMGALRGRPEPDTLASRQPSAAARTQAQELMREQSIEPALEQLRTHRGDLEAPLLAALVQRVGDLAVDAAADEHASRGRTAVSLLGVYPRKAAHEVRRGRRGKVHLWAGGDRFAGKLDLHHHAARQVDFGQTLCGQTVDAEGFERAPHGTWSTTAGARCRVCERQQNSARLVLAAPADNCILSAEVDLQVAAAGAVATAEVLAHQLALNMPCTLDDVVGTAERLWSNALLDACAPLLAARDTAALYDCLHESFPVEVCRAESDAGVERNTLPLEGLMDARAWRAALRGLEGHDRRGRLQFSPGESFRYALSQQVRTALDARIAAANS